VPETLRSQGRLWIVDRVVHTEPALKLSPGVDGVYRVSLHTSVLIPASGVRGMAIHSIRRQEPPVPRRLIAIHSIVVPAPGIPEIAGEPLPDARTSLAGDAAAGTARGRQDDHEGIPLGGERTGGKILIQMREASPSVEVRLPSNWPPTKAWRWEVDDDSHRTTASFACRSGLKGTTENGERNHLEMFGAIGLTRGLVQTDATMGRVNRPHWRIRKTEFGSANTASSRRLS
jgi:hypothetical protein